MSSSIENIYELYIKPLPREQQRLLLEVLRNELDVDDATWARSRGWAVSTAVMALPYYQHTNPFMTAQARHKIGVVLSE